jgi:AraC-like DNA-binding protein
MQYSLPHYTVRALVNFLVSQGLVRKEVLQVISTSDEALNSTEQRYLESEYEALLQYGAIELSTPNIGFAHGKAFELSFWGILGHIVAAAPTLADALSYQKRYQCLLGNTGQAYHLVENDIITMRWLSTPNASANSIEQVITAWVAFAFSYTQHSDKPKGVFFTHSALTEVTKYEDFFGCPVTFNANFNGVKVKASSLTLPLTAYNEEVLNVLCSHAENKLRAKRLAASLDMISEYIVTTLPERVPSLAEISEYLGISERQLQRQLQKEKTNLSMLIESIRKHLAISYLSQTDHKLLYISSMLGYSEQSAFQRAFKRWSGITPHEFRANPVTIHLS